MHALSIFCFRVNQTANICLFLFKVTDGSGDSGFRCSAPRALGFAATKLNVDSWHGFERIVRIDGGWRTTTTWQCVFESPDGVCVAVVRHSTHTAGSFERGAYSAANDTTATWSSPANNHLQPPRHPVTMATVFRHRLHDDGSREIGLAVVASLRLGVDVGNNRCDLISVGWCSLRASQ